MGNQIIVNVSIYGSRGDERPGSYRNQRPVHGEIFPIVDRVTLVPQWNPPNSPAYNPGWVQQTVCLLDAQGHFCVAVVCDAQQGPLQNMIAILRTLNVHHQMMAWHIPPFQNQIPPQINYDGYPYMYPLYHFYLVIYIPEDEKELRMAVKKGLHEHLAAYIRRDSYLIGTGIIPAEADIDGQQLYTEEQLLTVNSSSEENASDDGAGEEDSSDYMEDATDDGTYEEDSSERYIHE